jgi:hypothetical protein
VLADLETLPAPARTREDIDALLAERGVKVVGYEDWHAIDAIEVERGKAKGKVRDKLPTVEEMLAALE